METRQLLVEDRDRKRAKKEKERDDKSTGLNVKYSTVVNDGVIKRFKYLALDRDTSVAELIDEALRQYLERQPENKER